MQFGSNCPACGRVSINAEEIRLSGAGRGPVTASFACPMCACPCAVPVSRAAVPLLVARGAGAPMRDEPAPLTAADMGRFVELLDDEAFCQQLMDWPG